MIHLIFRPDIDFLGQTSRIFGHCRDVLKCCTSLPSSLWASPLRPTQSSKTGLRVRNRKCQILAHPSNVRKFYWHAPENLYLLTSNLCPWDMSFPSWRKWWCMLQGRVQSRQSLVWFSYECCWSSSWRVLGSLDPNWTASTALETNVQKYSAYRILWLSPCDKIAQNRVLWLFPNVLLVL